MLPSFNNPSLRATLRLLGGSCLLGALLMACQADPPPKFRLLSSEQTGVKFVNTVKPTPNLNIFNYMYFYNGGGVGAGDFNKDGLTDLIFTANQGENKLYLNKGNLKFEEITSVAFPPQRRPNGPAWYTGVSVVDINQDGLLDIYLSSVGDFLSLKGHNLLWVCTGIDKDGRPHFEEKSKAYNLDLVGFGTQAAFFDFDADGDLDMYQLNHSVHQNGTFGKRDLFLNTFHPRAGDRFFENQATKTPNGTASEPKFVEITQKIGINSSVVGYGLGLAVGDVNWDGYPDVYVGNDFHENDYLYINQKNGTYRDELHERIRHTSRFTMGVDIADLNNDLLPEIFTLDMLPYDPQILKRSEGEDAYYNFKFKLSQGYNVQFARNNLQLNTGQGQFSEIGMYAGVHATDWSWSSLLFDFENDGKKDIFISNGINKRMNDMDYINFVSADEIQQKIAEKRFDESDASLVDLLPEVKIPNKFYSNGTELIFTDEAEAIEGNPPSYSNGALCADLDNDGDLDVVTNNINDEAFVYENLAQNTRNKSLTVLLKGSSGNLNAIGAKCLIYTDKGKQYQEKFPVRGFQSSAETPLLFGLGTATRIDSVQVIWPDGTWSVVKRPPFDKPLTVSYQAQLPTYDYNRLTLPNAGFKDIAAEVGLALKHQENQFNEFDREALIPNMMSTEGPALAVGDINGDGLDDVFLGGARGIPAKIMTQTPTGKFVESNQPVLVEDADFEDIDAVWVDVNADRRLDLIVGSGGNEYFGKSPFLRPRLYLNGGGVSPRLTKAPLAFGEGVINAQVVRVADINGDTFPDVFIGARSVPFSYGTAPESYLFINDGKGNFSEQTDLYAPDLKKAGMVKDAHWADIDADRDLDLVVAYDWGKIMVYEKQGKRLVAKALTERKGWWNMLKPADIDNDGDLDLVCGNLGLNSRLRASPQEPVRMYVNDFDDNGRPDQIITYYLQGQETIFADKREVEKQLPYVKKQFIYAKDFAKASLREVFGNERIDKSQVLEADCFDNVLLENKGKEGFVLKSLGGAAQFTAYYAAEAIPNPQTKRLDLLLLGNFYECNIQMGLYDADGGQLFQNQGIKGFVPIALMNKRLEGQVRRIRPIKIARQKAYIVARNNDTLMVLSNL